MAVPLGIIGMCFSEVWKDRDRILLCQRLRSRLVQWGYSAADIPMLFHSFDHGCDGNMDFKEFRRMLEMLKLGMSKDRIVQLFKMMDHDGGGTIDDKEFVRTLFPYAYHDLYDELGQVRPRFSTDHRISTLERLAID